LKLMLIKKEDCKDFLKNWVRYVFALFLQSQIKTLFVFVTGV
jgi:hypothetical protein